MIIIIGLVVAVAAVVVIITIHCLDNFGEGIKNEEGLT